MRIVVADAATVVGGGIDLEFFKFLILLNPPSFAQISSSGFNVNT